MEKPRGAAQPCRLVRQVPACGRGLKGSIVAGSGDLGVGEYRIAISVSKSVAQGGSLDRVACIRHLGDLAHSHVPLPPSKPGGLCSDPVDGAWRTAGRSGSHNPGAGGCGEAPASHGDFPSERRSSTIASLETYRLDGLHHALGLAVWIGAVHPDGPFVGYDWSVGLAGGPATFLIYDVTDEIALPPELHKQPIAFEEGVGEICAGKVIHLLGHYCVCEFANTPS
jgi:hypothetical protein